VQLTSCDAIPVGFVVVFMLSTYVVQLTSCDTIPVVFVCCFDNFKVRVQRHVTLFVFCFFCCFDVVKVRSATSCDYVISCCA
jgi:hypothetical protein